MADSNEYLKSRNEPLGCGGALAVLLLLLLVNLPGLIFILLCIAIMMFVG